jgi:hypothetical protein
MKIAITGHKHGLGAALYDKFTIYNRSGGHNVVGFDIEDGQDIGNRSTLGKIVYAAKDVDMFINNAYHATGQTELLKYLLKLWQHQNKVLVHIGTYLVYAPDDETRLPLHNEYIAQKKVQKSIIDEHRKTDSTLKILQINPGLMDTAFLDTMQVPKIPNLQNTLDCADAIMYNINMLAKDIYIKELTLDNL